METYEVKDSFRDYWTVTVEYVRRDDDPIGKSPEPWDQDYYETVWWVTLKNRYGDSNFSFYLSTQYDERPAAEDIAREFAQQAQTLAFDIMRGGMRLQE